MRRLTSRLHRNSTEETPMPRTRSQHFALLALCVAALIVGAAPAHADEYKLLGCSSTARDPFYTIENNTTSPQNPAGIFNFWNWCGGAGGDPPGNSAFLRIEENQANGYAGNGAKLVFNFDTPNQFIHFRAAGGYSREPGSFNEGWRSRLLISGGSAGSRELMSQGSGLCNCGDQWATTSTFASHLWPLGGYLDFTRFTWEMVCMSYGGCDRSGVNETDLNGMVFILSDEYPSVVNLIGTDQPFLSGQWVRGPQAIGYNWTELGSGMKMERVKVDGAVLSEIDHSCDVGFSQTNGEYARTYQPCDTGADVKRYVPIDTASLLDGAHTVQACTQDYAQWDSTGTGGESCDPRTIHVDNTPPGKPAALAIRSANPSRYLDHFGATFSLPPDPGSPIAHVHYMIRNGKGEVVVPEQVVSGTNPTEVADIKGPTAPGAYTLKLWLEDSVGFQGPASEVAIPHDTTPPAAPQELHVAGQTSHWAEKVDLQWSNIVDEGSPIDTAHYEVVDASGEAVDGGVHTVSGDNVEAIPGLPTPSQRAHYKLRVWLKDAEGNVGAASTVPLPIDTTPPAAPQGLQVAAPDTPRSKEGFDLRWSDIGDEGSPIDAAHYEVLDGAGKLAVPTQTVTGDGVDSIQDVQAPDPSGTYTLKLWLQDEEGNAGAPATVPLSYECPRSPVPGGATLSAGFAEGTVQQGQGSTLRGALRQSSGAPVAGAPLCVFEQIEGEDARHYLGLAYTDAAGDYGFGVAPGPNRTLRAVYRPGNRRLVAQADLKTTVKPTLLARKSVIRNGQVAHLEGRIPGPRNDDVVIVLQVRQGKGWLAFRRYRTRGGGRFAAAYRFRRTTKPTDYEFRAQLRETGGYPYLQGESEPLDLKVVPKGWHRHRKASASQRCARARRALRRLARGRPRRARKARRRVQRICARGHGKGRRGHARHGHRGRG